MAQRYKFSIESKRLPPSLSGDPSKLENFELKISLCVQLAVFSEKNANIVIATKKSPPTKQAKRATQTCSNYNTEKTLKTALNCL